MRYKLLGRSGLRVSELCLGTMTFGDEWGWGGSSEESRKMFDIFANVGGNFIDTANAYTNGTSEKLVGEFIAPERDRFVVATKYTANTRPGDPNAGGNARKSLVQGIEGSLKRLGTEYIDLLWVHAWDFMTPIEEVMRSLDDAVRQGKVLYIGISDTPAWIVSRANTLAQCYGWTPFIGLQIEYSLIERTPERDLVPMANALELGITPWSPLAGGVLSGKYNKGKDSEAAQEEGDDNGGGSKRKDQGGISAELTERNLNIAAEVGKIAEEVDRTAPQVALNWLRQQPGTVIPIIGGRKASQIEDNLGCLEFTLTPEQMQRLEAVSGIELGFPHDFLQGEMLNNFVHGGTLDQIDRPLLRR
ncbi:aldo/keto reductase [Gloeobacter violaceus]|nr:aldo/keto reductase [Gloeobacter violaceus]